MADATADELIRNLSSEDNVMMIQAFSYVNNEEKSSPTLYVINGNCLLISLNYNYFELEKLSSDDENAPFTSK